MGKFLHNMKLYEEGVIDGIEQGKQFLLHQLLIEKLGSISDQYVSHIYELDGSVIMSIALSIFDINSIEDLNKYLYETN